VGNPLGKQPLGTLRRRLEENITPESREIGCVDMILDGDMSCRLWCASCQESWCGVEAVSKGIVSTSETSLKHVHDESVGATGKVKELMLWNDITTGRMSWRSVRIYKAASAVGGGNCVTGGAWRQCFSDSRLLQVEGGVDRTNIDGLGQSVE
jgi:hypothetical protein